MKTKTEKKKKTYIKLLDINIIIRDDRSMTLLFVKSLILCVCVLIYTNIRGLLTRTWTKSTFRKHIKPPKQCHTLKRTTRPIGVRLAR